MQRTVTNLVGFVVFGAMCGCGAPEADVETRNGQIVAIDPENQPAEFKYLSPVSIPLSTGTGDPGWCTPSAPHSKVIFTRDTSGFIQGLIDDAGAQGSWSKYGGAGSLRNLGGRPACGFFPSAQNPYTFILLAKGATAPNGSSDKHLFWSKGSWTYDPVNTPPVSAQTQWAAIDGTQYNTNGNPAVGTRDGQLVVVYLNDSGQLAGNYWAGNAFSGTLTHPNLPTGWTGVGTPAIAFAEAWAQKFVIFVRAKNSFNQYRFYRTFFQTDHFANATGGGAPTWASITLPSGSPAIGSDPGYEFDTSIDFAAGTLYYRSGDSKIYQASAVNGVDQFNTSTVKAILGSDSPSISGSPIAIGGVIYEGGTHWVLARGTDNSLYFGESFQNQYLAPN